MECLQEKKKKDSQKEKRNGEKKKRDQEPEPVLKVIVEQPQKKAPNLMELDISTPTSNPPLSSSDDQFTQFVGPTDLFKTPVLQQSVPQVVPSFETNGMFNQPNSTPNPVVSKQSILELYNSPMTNVTPVSPVIPNANGTPKANYNVVLDPVYKPNVRPVYNPNMMGQPMYNGNPAMYMPNPAMYMPNPAMYNPNLQNPMYSPNIMMSPNMSNSTYVNPNHMNTIKTSVGGSLF